MLVADPRQHASLLAAAESDEIAPIGLGINHLPGVEAPMDLSAALLAKGAMSWFGSGICKSTIAQVPLRWMTGFRRCDRVANYRTDLYQLHLK